MKETRADQDSPWKDALQRFFEPAMRLYFPNAHREIDWTKGVQFLDKELQRIRPKAATGRRTVDLLAQVHLKAGAEIWILVHVEVQGQPEAGFPDRMYGYNYRILDKFARPVASFGILTDTRVRWRPNRYHREVLGCEVTMRFPIAKLLDFRQRREELEASDSPIAVFTLAFLDWQENANNPKKQLAAKLHAVRRLRGLGMSQADREELFRLVDWIVDLPKPEQLQFDEEIAREEQEGIMPFVSSIERRAIVRGQVALLMRQLEKKFGSLGEAERQRLAEADTETLMEWADRLVTAERLDEVFH